MKSNTHSLFILLLLCASLFMNAQHTREEMMSQLEFLTGNWVGNATTIKNDTVAADNPAFESIQYQLDGSILTIDLFSEPLQLHTVINYDESDQCFYYNPFYKTGAGRYPAQLINGQLVVYASDTKRFVFGVNESGQFVEYGEQFIDGVWQKYFEDTFVRS